MKTAFFLMGPTASGKTTLAITLAEKWPIHLISVDSGMVYQGLDIGTAKPTQAELKKAPHQLIDLCDPSQPYSAAKFREDALAAITDAFHQNKIPLLVGGTMLYFHLLKQGLSELPTADTKIRDRLLAQAKQQGWQSLHDELRRVDPISAQKIQPTDPQRIQRALEIYWTTGKTRTELWAQPASEPNLPFNILPLILAPGDRTTLHSRIEIRFHQMLKQGFLEEVERLYNRRDLHISLPSMRLVGYRQAWAYLSGHCSKETMIESAIIATRQLAKRQLTWLRRWEGVPWIESEGSKSFSQVEKHLSTAISH